MWSSSDNYEISGDLIIGSDLLNEWQAVINLKDNLLQGVYKNTSWNIEIVCDHQEDYDHRYFMITDKVFLVQARTDFWIDVYCQLLMGSTVWIRNALNLKYMLQRV